MLRSVFRTFLPTTLVCLSILTISLQVQGQEPKVKPLRALLVLGGCCHDYAVQKELLTKGISERAHVEFSIAHDPDKGTAHLNPVYEQATWADGFDVIIHDECSSDVKDIAVIDRILEPHRKGLPAVILHCGMHSYRSEGYPKAITPWFEFTGLQSTGHGPQTPIEIQLLPDSSPIVLGQPNWTTVNEELYNNSEGNWSIRPKQSRLESRRSRTVTAKSRLRKPLLRGPMIIEAPRRSLLQR